MDKEAERKAFWTKGRLKTAKQQPLPYESARGAVRGAEALARNLALVWFILNCG